MSQDQEKFECFGLLELFGHQRLAGKLSDQAIGGVHFLRIDVPAVGDVPPYTRFFTQGAIYGMTVTTEDVARRLASSLRARPVQAYQLAEPEAPSLPAPPAPPLVGDLLAGATEPPATPVSCGAIYEGTVTRILDFGAVVNLDPGVDGLLHIGQIAHHRVDNVADYLAEGQVVHVKVIEIDERGRVLLSMKALSQVPEPAEIEDDGFPF